MSKITIQTVEVAGAPEDKRWRAHFVRQGDLSFSFTEAATEVAARTRMQEILDNPLAVMATTVPVGRPVASDSKLSGTVWALNPERTVKKRIPADQFDGLAAQGWTRCGPRTLLAA